MLDGLRQDIRYALRTMAASPAFTTVTILSLALGIGANTAIFSLLDAVMLKYLPVQHPEELLLVSVARDDKKSIGFSNPIWEGTKIVVSNVVLTGAPVAHSNSEFALGVIRRVNRSRFETDICDFRRSSGTAEPSASPAGPHGPRIEDVHSVLRQTSETLKGLILPASPRLKAFVNRTAVQ